MGPNTQVPRLQEYLQTVEITPPSQGSTTRGPTPRRWDIPVKVREVASLRRATGTTGNGLDSRCPAPETGGHHDTNSNRLWSDVGSTEKSRGRYTDLVSSFTSHLRDGGGLVFKFYIETSDMRPSLIKHLSY